MNKKK
jgi:ABC-type multidrug transport system fused ATPase/permease subunit